MVELSAAIVDYGLGNLYSVGQACATAGMRPLITADKAQIAAAATVILPGVGAFGDAIAHLHRLDLVQPLVDIAAAGKPLVGICLGMQLLMRESYEFGSHKGLGLIEGEVIPFERGAEGAKVPQVGWNRIYPGKDGWSDSPLEKVAAGEYMYFVHSYYTAPERTDLVLAHSRYAGIEFCAGLRYGNVHAYQFHPERSGSAGLKIYARLAQMLRGAGESKEKIHD